MQAVSLEAAVMAITLSDLEFYQACLKCKKPARSRSSDALQSMI